VAWLARSYPDFLLLQNFQQNCEALLVRRTLLKLWQTKRK
jgi:hypothetical protein